MVELTEKKSFIVYLLVILLISGCANQLPPGGGDVDRVPPKIEEVFPPDGTVHFQDDYFELNFSEYVDKRSLQEAVFISPALEGERKFKWSGKSVRMYFPEKLKNNFTYVITIGTDLVDYNNRNRLAESYTFRFSTGEKIDRGMITGKVFTAKPSGVMLFAYRNDNNSEINPTTVKPDYVSQAGIDGAFKLQGLAWGRYRVFAVEDQFRDFLYHFEQDKFGVPHEDIILSETDSTYSNLSFFLSNTDTLKPRLLSAVMTDKNHVLMNFSEVIDSSSIKKNNFFIVDSSGNSKTEAVYAFKGNAKLTEYVLAVRNDISINGNLFLFAYNFSDMNGNTTEEDYVSLTSTDKPDTSKPSIVKTDPVNFSTKVDFIGSEFLFQFDDAFDSSEAVNGISFVDTAGNKIGSALNFVDDAAFRLKPIEDLKSNKDYVIRINFNYLTDIAGNKRDSIFEFRFKTINGLDFTGVSGSLQAASKFESAKIVLDGIDGRRLKYTGRLNSDGKFSLERVEPGKYLLWCYDDRDKNDNYSFGWPHPFKPAEKFIFYKDTLDLRPRWSVTDIKLISEN